MDGEIGEGYLLRETPAPYYAQRTEWNVRDADGTVVLYELDTTGDGSYDVTRSVAFSLARTFHSGENAPDANGD